MTPISLGSEESHQETLGNLARGYVVLITGQTAAGKDTLALNILEACPPECRPGGFINTGDIFETRIPEFSPDIRERLRVIKDSGRLQHPGIDSALVTDAVLCGWEKDRLLVIGGSPCSAREANFLHSFIVRFLDKRIFLVHLTIDEDLAIERILHRNKQEGLAGGPQRTDTQDLASIRNKLAYHESKVVPAVDEMDRKERVQIARIHVVRGMSPKAVFGRVMGLAPIFERAR